MELSELASKILDKIDPTESDIHDVEIKVSETTEFHATIEVISNYFHSYDEETNFDSYEGDAIFTVKDAELYKVKADDYEPYLTPRLLEIELQKQSKRKR